MVIQQLNAEPSKHWVKFELKISSVARFICVLSTVISYWHCYTYSPFMFVLLWLCEELSKMNFFHSTQFQLNGHGYSPLCYEYVWIKKLKCEMNTFHFGCFSFYSLILIYTIYTHTPFTLPISRDRNIQFV